MRLKFKVVNQVIKSLVDTLLTGRASFSVASYAATTDIELQEVERLKLEENNQFVIAYLNTTNCVNLVSIQKENMKEFYLIKE